MMRVTDRLIAPSRASAHAALLYAARWYGPNGDADITAYINEVYRLASLLGLDASLVIAQSVHETTDRTTGRPWASPWWRTRRNPAGLGITGDADENERSATFATGKQAAWAHLAHLLVYAVGPIGAGSVWFQRVDVGLPIIRVDPRYEAYVAAHGNVAKAKRLAGLAGMWAVDPDYATKIAARGNAIFPDIEDQENAMPSRTRPVIVIDAGHRSTDRSGNPTEMALTGFMADASVKALRAAGYEAFWYQRDLDRDSDPDETIGDLNTVALGIGRWIAARVAEGRDVVFWSEHYNGSHSRLHAIVPDVTDLRTAYPGGAPSDDTYANNILDRRLATEMMASMARDGLGLLFDGAAIELGVMLERETGVGRDGFRLAVFAATVTGRHKAVRLVIENGGTADAAALRDDFTERCAAAKVRAVQQVYGETPPANVKPIPISGPIEAKWIGDILYLPLRQSRLTAIQETPRRHHASDDAPEVGRPVPAGDTVTLAYCVIGTNYLASKNGSYCRAADFVRKGSQ